MASVIKLHAVTKEYGSGEQKSVVLGPLSLSIATGEKIAIVGPSGSGKSTLLSIIGFLSTPSAGTYRLADQDTSKINEPSIASLRREKIGFVFQGFHLIEELRVYENVELPLVYRGWSAERRAAEVKKALERVNLHNKERRFPSQLSGGEQQRVAIARALAGNSSLILADEPTGNLDSATGQQIMGYLFDLVHENPACTLILVTHDRSLAHMMNRVVVLRDGLFVADGPPKKVFVQ